MKGFGGVNWKDLPQILVRICFITRNSLFSEINLLNKIVIQKKQDYTVFFFKILLWLHTLLF